MVKPYLSSIGFVYGNVNDSRNYCLHYCVLLCYLKQVKPLIHIYPIVYSIQPDNCTVLGSPRVFL